MSVILTTLMRSGNPLLSCVRSAKQTFCATCIRREVEATQATSGRVRSSIGTRSKRSNDENDEPIGAGYFLLVFPVATFILGTWQVKRRKWKLNLISELEQLQVAPPVTLPESVTLIDDLEYRRVLVRGTFDHSREVYVMMRPPLDTGGRKAGGLISSKTQVGNYVITAFKLADRDITILVNRGWVPKTQKRPSHRAQGQVEGEVEFIGVVRKTENRPPFGPKRKDGTLDWYNRDVTEMAKTLNTAPIFIDADRDSSVPGGPIGGQTRLSLRNEHWSYIITWYTLSLVTGVGCYMRLFR